MNIGQAIYGGLTGDSRIADILSDRVYPVYVPQGAIFPAIIYEITSEPIKTKERETTEYSFVFSLTIKHKEYQKAHEIADLCQSIFDKRQKCTIGGINFKFIELSETLDGGWSIDFLNFDLTQIYTGRIQP